MMKSKTKENFKGKRKKERKYLVGAFQWQEPTRQQDRVDCMGNEEAFPQSVLTALGHPPSAFLALAHPLHPASLLLLPISALASHPRKIRPMGQTWPVLMRMHRCFCCQSQYHFLALYSYFSQQRIEVGCRSL